MYPPFPYKYTNCLADRYIPIKVVDRTLRMKTEHATRNWGIKYKKLEDVEESQVVCYPEDEKLYNVYLSHLKKLCREDNIEDNIDVSVVATPVTGKRLPNGLTSDYKTVPGVLEPWDRFTRISHHFLRLLAHITF